VLATVAENHKHAEVMKKNPDMEHDDPNAKRVLPYADGELVWKFYQARHIRVRLSHSRSL